MKRHYKPGMYKRTCRQRLSGIEEMVMKMVNAQNLEATSNEIQSTQITRTYRGRTTCTHPNCLLKQPDFNAENLADVAIRLLSGESLGRIASRFERILARPQCKRCALHVMQGRKTYSTEQEWKRLDELGQWHHRRQRRSQRMRTGYSTIK